MPHPAYDIDEQSFLKQLKAGLSACRFTQDRIERLAALLQSVTKAADATPMTITKLKDDLDRVIESLAQSNVQRIADGKHQGREDVMMIRSEDVLLLADALLEITRPHYPPGHEIYVRVAHDKGASSVALNPPSETPHRTPAYSAALYGVEPGR